MALSEFDLIRQYITPQSVIRDDVALGIGDDCALLRIPEGQQLAVTLDTLVAGRHFLTDCDPVALGHKSLAVNLSDLAAMGAEPAWATLSLTLPDEDREWLASFMYGFSQLASRYAVQLVGGDVTRGPLSISVQAHGFVPANLAIRRDSAQPDDLVFVSGSLGDAALALAMLDGRVAATDQFAALKYKLDYPQPRIELGLALRGIANAMIDLSDGLAGDIEHICEASNLGAELDVSRLPFSRAFESAGDWNLAATGGDDYELCFTVDADKCDMIATLAEQLHLPLTQVGRMREQRGVIVRDVYGHMLTGLSGFDHFKEN